MARWFAWFSLALALILAIVPIGWLGVILGLPLWTLIASVLLWMLQADEPVAARPPEAQS